MKANLKKTISVGVGRINGPMDVIMMVNGLIIRGRLDSSIKP